MNDVRAHSNFECDQMCLIFLFQEKDDPATEFHYDNLVGTVVNLFFAGTETTSSTIRYALNVLMKYPKVQGRSHAVKYSKCFLFYFFFQKQNAFNIIPNLMC